MRLKLHVIVEIAPGHFPRAADQNLQRPEDPAVEEAYEDGENQRRQSAGDPQSNQQRVILPADFRGKTLQRRVQVRGQVDGHDLQVDDFADPTR